MEYSILVEYFEITEQCPSSLIRCFVPESQRPAVI
jgi:hypothetical protein